MADVKLTPEEIAKLVKQRDKARERSKRSQAKRRAQLKEQGIVPITVMVSEKRAALVREMLKALEKADAEPFGLYWWKVIPGRNNDKPMWWHVWDSNRNGVKS